MWWGIDENEMRKLGKSHETIIKDHEKVMTKSEECYEKVMWK